MIRYLNLRAAFWIGSLGSFAVLGVMGLGSVSGQDAPSLPSIDKLKHEAYTEKLIDKVTFKMVPIPGGTFMMGSPSTEKSREADEGPQHPVTLRPFWMGECEVSWDEYDYFWEKRP